MKQFNLEDAQEQLPVLVEAAIKGEEVYIVDDEQLIKLVPIVNPKRQPKFGSAKGFIVMSDDFDAPLNDFDEYIS